MHNTARCLRLFEQVFKVHEMVHLWFIPSICGVPGPSPPLIVETHASGFLGMAPEVGTVDGYIGLSM